MCNGRTSKEAAIYPFELCKDILTGFRNHMLIDGRLSRGSVGLNCIVRDDLEDGSQANLQGVPVAENSYRQIRKLRGENEEVFMDDLTGQRLDPTLVKAARKLEMDYVKAKGLRLKRPTKECFERAGRPPVTVRWVGTNKGDDKSPNIRSRLVARQICGPGQQAMFAPCTGLRPSGRC